ncbi:MAG: hypothetical protein CUN49_07105 [Candidatus Thermofonsia Clade 1 bacterium]|jgi:hypothetical protein|uniref:Uncharacterized protein n=1 Tax=Candidatus Thermofonsia Clade 1 bacterium TaxID=2364210 RepID=A0A2M8PF26_9CHLR|nr:MAG: hypothetical protein CUN49_07105 [Candidatus Thermofonsia Clade 1 bacterium]RMF50214.1 MAG: hypothetical protein D6749_11100 [Chloroflexota bacterium]
MTPEQERATRALFEGDRSQVERLLRERAQTPYEWWLLACAVEDEREREALLRRVHERGELPYADLAWQILQREAYFAAQLAQGAWWANRRFWQVLAYLALIFGLAFALALLLS